MSRKLWGAVYAGVCAAVLATQWTVTSIVNTPYMDETFHVPQALRYCQAGMTSAIRHVEYDAKLTTPPGMYLLSCSLISAVSRLMPTSAADLHSLAALRLTNSVLALALFVVLYELIKDVSTAHVANASRGIVLWNTVNTFVFPVSCFYYFLYYTDTPSTFAVLLCYLLARKRWYYVSAVVGLVSIAIRQTNVIWLCFSAAADLVQQVQKAEAKKLQAKEKKLTDEWVLDHRSFLSTTLSFYTVKLVRIMLPFVLVVSAFAAFVKWNGGIVLGDKQNHTFSLHLPQLLYFVTFLGVLGSPILVTFDAFSAYVVFTIRKLRSLRGLCFMTAAFVLTVLGIRYFTYEHPFLLSDNRHYSFYVWKDIYRRYSWARYALITVYFACSWFAYRKLGKYQTSIFITLYVGATALALIPSPLLEFRYFILPYVLYRVHVPVEKTWKLALELALYLAVNAATLYMFLYRPFTWPQEPGVLQRFMW
ncbi:glucosyltransferase [Sorochytrium milnesiophthora]